MSRVPAGSMPVSAIRFPKSRKNFFLLNFYFLLSPVLLIAHFFHPIDDFPVQRLLNGDMSHCGRRRRAVPMLFIRRKPDHITRPDFLNWSAPTLRPPKARCDDQRLAKWMCMPGGASTELKRDACATNTRRFGRFEQRVNSNCPGKPIGRTLAGILRTRSFYLHLLNVVVSSSPSTLNCASLLEKKRNAGENRIKDERRDREGAI